MSISAMITALFLTPQCAGVPLPPWPFDHVPKRPIALEVIDAKDVAAECKRLGTASDNARACYSGRLDLIIIPRSDGWIVSTEDQACILRHELGHANGWHHA